MLGQVNYYNDFGEIYKQSILSCPEPELWTTDYDTKGRVFREMRERVEQQQKLISAYFTPIIPVLDIGCGFGRQSISLAKNGYTLTGTDTSDVFIDIVKELFLKHGFEGRFICTDIINGKNLPGQQKQILFWTYSCKSSIQAYESNGSCNCSSNTLLLSLIFDHAPFRKALLTAPNVLSQLLCL